MKDRYGNYHGARVNTAGLSSNQARAAFAFVSAELDEEIAIDRENAARAVYDHAQSVADAAVIAARRALREYKAIVPDWSERLTYRND